jgi:hypothetical protein
MQPPCSACCGHLHLPPCCFGLCLARSEKSGAKAGQAPQGTQPTPICLSTCSEPVPISQARQACEPEPGHSLQPPLGTHGSRCQLNFPTTAPSFLKRETKHILAGRNPRYSLLKPLISQKKSREAASLSLDGHKCCEGQEE